MLLNLGFGLHGLSTPAVAAPEGSRERCSAITDPTERLRCYDGATPAPGAGAAPVAAPKAASGAVDGAVQEIGGWRLVRATHPTGGKDAVSIMKTMELSRSDPGLVGLMVRCAETEPEVLVVVIPPVPPREKPVVSIVDSTERLRFEGSVTPPGSAILLPAQAADLARSRWPGAKALTIEVAREGSTERGVVSMDGFAAGYAALRSACVTR